MRSLRPTLFDLLAHRALTVFRRTETRIAEPPSRFRVNDAKYFSLFEDFASLRIPGTDSMSWELQALKLYQQLEHTHLNAATPDAMVDNALARMAFVRSAVRCPVRTRSTWEPSPRWPLACRTTRASATCLWHKRVGIRRWAASTSG